MDSRTAKNLMVSIDEYPVVPSTATLFDAVMQLDKSRRTMESGRQPYQAVLVADARGTIVGKLGQLAILKALEPRSQVVRDRDTLEKAGVGDAILRAALENLTAFQHDLSEMCSAAAALPVRAVMHPINEHIDSQAPIGDIIHQIVRWQTLSLLVLEDGKPIGIVRLADICDEVVKEMRQTNSQDQT